MKFLFIGQVAEEQRQLPPGVRFPVVFMCRMLGVTRQGFYEWRKRPVSAHDQKDAELAARIRYLHQERHKNRAGIERILWDLQEEGYVTSGRRVRRLARAAGLQCVHPGPSARTTVQDSRAIGGLVDLVDRQFTAPEPDQLWVGDITYIWTYSGFAYLATLIDMCSNKVVGWAVDDHMRTGLVLEAVDNALAARGPGIGIGELVVHHDRGSQYTSGRYRDRLFAEGIIPSVGHTGICYDNAAAESFNATIKKELIYQHVWRDAGEVRTAVFDYIERYYNHVRKNPAMCKQKMVRRPDGGRAVLTPGSVMARGVSQERRAPWLVQRGPVADTIGEPRVHGGRVVREQVSRPPLRPAAPVLKRLWQVPVVEGDPGTNAGAE